MGPLWRRGVVVALAAMGLVLVASAPALGNPMPFPPSHTDTTFRVASDFSGVFWLFLLNLLVNLALYVFLLLVLMGSFADFRRILPSGLWFTLAVLGVVCVITTIGALVDYYLVMEPGFSLSHPTDRYISFDMAKWSAAWVIIFLSVLGPTVGIFAKPIRSALIGAGVVLVNIGWWFLSLHFGYDIAFLTIFVSVLLAPVLLKILVDKFNNGVAPQTFG